MRPAQPIGERLQLIATARCEPEVAAFFGKGFGGGRANALRGAGDEDALAAQMQIHGTTRWLGEAGWPKLLGGTALYPFWQYLARKPVSTFRDHALAVNIALQRCAAPRFGPLQGLQNRRRCRVGKSQGSSR